VPLILDGIESAWDIIGSRDAQLHAIRQEFSEAAFAAEMYSAIREIFFTR